MADSSDSACIAFTGWDCVHVQVLVCLFKWHQSDCFSYLTKQLNSLCDSTNVCSRSPFSWSSCWNKTQMPSPSHFCSELDHIYICFGGAVERMYRNHSVSVCNKTWIGKLAFYFLACNGYCSVQLACRTLIQNLSQHLNITASVNGMLGSLCSCCLHITASPYNFLFKYKFALSK